MTTMALDKLTNGVLAICALIVGGLYVKNEVVQTRAVPPVSQAPTKVGAEDWRAASRTGIRIGPPDAPVTIVEFMDFRCPYCGTLVKRLETLKTEFPSEFAVVFQHFPLNEGISTKAAVAFECAGSQGRAEAMYKLLYAQQDSIGTKDWLRFASEAGVFDFDRFAKCQSGGDALPRINAGVQLGRSFGVTGTPTVVVNGWRLPPGPTMDDLRSEIRRALKRAQNSGSRG